MITHKKIHFSKKSIILISLTGLVLVIVAVAVTALGSSKTSLRSDISFPAITDAEIANVKSKVNSSLTYDIVNANPDRYENEVIQWPAKVFISPEKDNSMWYLQVYAEENDKSYLVIYKNTDMDIAEGDTLMVTGVVRGSMDGENAFGASLSKVVIYASYIKKVTRQEAFAPTIEKLAINQTNTQNKFTVSLDSIERAKNETRVHMTVSNNSSDTVSFYNFNISLTQGSKQFEQISQYGDNDQELLSGDYKPGIKSSGIVIFPAITNLDNLKLYVDKPYSSSWDLNWEDIVFKVN